MKRKKHHRPQYEYLLLVFRSMNQFQNFENYALFNCIGKMSAIVARWYLSAVNRVFLHINLTCKLKTQKIVTVILLGI